MTYYDFHNELRSVVEKKNRKIIFIGGQSGSGKTYLIKEILAILGRHYTALSDLADIRKTVLRTDYSAKENLYRSMKCFKIPSKLHLSSQIRRIIYKSSTALLDYYLWLERISRAQVLEEAYKQPKSVKWWFIEVVAPINFIWQVCDLHVYLNPPPWKIEQQIMKREKIAQCVASVIRRLQENATEKANAQPFSNPNIYLSNNGKREAYAIVRELIEGQDGDVNFRA